MSRKLLLIYRVLFLAVVITWVIPDFFTGQAWAQPFNEFWQDKAHYYALGIWIVFDLGWCLGSSWQKRQHHKRCTLRHTDDPKRHNFVFVQKSDEKVESFKQGAKK